MKSVQCMNASIQTMDTLSSNVHRTHFTYSSVQRTKEIRHHTSRAEQDACNLAEHTTFDLGWVVEEGGNESRPFEEPERRTPHCLGPANRGPTSLNQNGGDKLENGDCKRAQQTKGGREAGDKGVCQSSIREPANHNGEVGGRANWRTVNRTNKQRKRPTTLRHVTTMNGMNGKLRVPTETWNPDGIEQTRQKNPNEPNGIQSNPQRHDESTANNSYRKRGKRRYEHDTPGRKIGRGTAWVMENYGLNRVLSCFFNTLSPRVMFVL